MPAQGSEHSGVAVRVLGQPSAASDDALARYFARFLADEHPGTSWEVNPGDEPPADMEAAA